MRYKNIWSYKKKRKQKDWAKHEDFIHKQQNIFSINNHKSSESVLIVDFSLASPLQPNPSRDKVRLKFITSHLISSDQARKKEKLGKVLNFKMGLDGGYQISVGNFKSSNLFPP